MIVGRIIGGSPVTPKTYILETESGEEIAGALVSSEQILTATQNDIREGSVAIIDTGVATGTKVIPAYFSTEGFQIVSDGAALSISGLGDYYDYTKMQAIICGFNTTVDDSVSAQKVVIGDNVYNTQSIEVVSTITKDANNQSVNLGITNDTGTYQIIRYFTFKEIE